MTPPEVTRIQIPQARVQELSAKYQIQQDGSGNYYISLNNQAQIAELQALLSGGGPANGGAIKGAQLERASVTETKAKPVVISSTTTTAVTIDSLLASLKAANFELEDGCKDELIRLLTEEGVTVSKEGNINATSEDVVQKINAGISKFAQTRQKKLVKFDMEKTDQEFINRLTQGDDPVISANGDGTYNVLDQERLTQALDKVEKEKTTTEKTIPMDVESTTTTVTDTEEPLVAVDDDLKHNRAGRKKARKDFEAALTEWVKDPENQYAMNYSIARNKYSKKISKQLGKLSKEIKSPEETLEKYIKEYATPEEKVFFSKLLSLAKEDEAELLAAYKRGTGDQRATFEGETGAAKKRIAALMRIAEDPNFDHTMLMERMAVVDVMSARSEKQIQKDIREFIEDEAERQAEAVEAEQNIANTRVHFTKDAKKQAESMETNSAIEHVYLSKKEQKIVMEFPDEFCTIGTAADHDFQVNGKYYKFSQEKFSKFCENVTDSRFFDETSQNNFGNDHNLTLNEGRKGWMNQIYIDKDGNRRSLEQVIGNDNGKVGNGELNTLRHFIEKSGHSIDTNGTAAKRLLHVLEGVGIGAALGFGTALAGSWLAGAVSIAGKTADQMVHYSTRTPDRYVPYSGKTDARIVDHTFTVDGKTISYSGTTDGRYVVYNDNVVTTDYYTDQWGTTSVTHDTPVTGTVWVDGQPYEGTIYIDPETHVVQVKVDGQEYSGTVLAEGQTVEGDVKANGQEYKDSGQHHLKTAANAAIFGGIAGGIGSLINMGSVHAKGRGYDGIVKLVKRNSTPTEEATSLQLQIPQAFVVEERSGQITEGTEVQKFRAKKWQGPAAYSIMYQYPDGSPVNPMDFARAYKAKIGGDMSNHFFYAYPELMVGDKVIVPVQDLAAAYARVPEGIQGTARGVDVTPEAFRTISGYGKLNF